MSSLDSFLRDLTRHDVRLWVSEDQLHYRAPEGSLTPAIRAELKQRKTELMELAVSPAAPLAGDNPIVKTSLTSYAQQALWFFEQQGGDGSAYHISAQIQLKGELDARALERALRAIILRHDILRATFEEKDGALQQIISAGTRFELPIECWKDVAPSGAQERISRRIAEEIAAPISLSAGPLIRARLFMLSAEEYLLSIVAHHIIADGWSADLIVREIAELYPFFAKGEWPIQAPLFSQYSDFAIWQKAHSETEAYNRALGYFEDHLAGTPGVIELPTIRPRPVRPSYRAGHAFFSISSGIVATLREIARGEDATLFHIALAALQFVLFRWSGMDDFVVGVMMAGRSRREFRNLVGLFVNRLPVRADLSGDPSFTELLRRARDAAVQVAARQDAPFEKIVERLHPTRNLAIHPIFQVLLNFHTPPLASDMIAGVQTDVALANGNATQFDLSLTLSDIAGELRCQLEYSMDLFEESTAERFTEHFCRALKSFAEDENKALSEICLLSDSERKLILEGFNRTAADYPSELCVHEL
ncbi:condensation domain-containing protein, partial [Methylosinus sp. Sm6]|uniref:condensation domain-containing protein n=1 Tax=Methylosinus sp. Sm6 TaxID=2866948 RepID=UPI001D6AFEEF